MTKYRTATYIGLTPMTFLWGVTQVTDYLTRMHTAHLANVSKSVTKNATFPRTGGLPCLITHSCMSATSPTVVGGLIFCISATPHLGTSFPLFHALLHRCCAQTRSNTSFCTPTQRFYACHFLFSHVFKIFLMY